MYTHTFAVPQSKTSHCTVVLVVSKMYICGSFRKKLSTISFHTCFVLLCSMHYSAELSGLSSYALHRCMTTCTWHAYSACTCMSPALKGNSVLQHIRCGKIIIHNRIIFNFYPELAHVQCKC